MRKLRLVVGVIALSLLGLAQVGCFPDPPACSTQRPCDETGPADADDASDTLDDATADAEVEVHDDSDAPVETTVAPIDTAEAVETEAPIETVDAFEAESSPPETETTAEETEVETADEVVPETTETEVVARECDDNTDCARLDGTCAQGVCQSDGTCVRVPVTGLCDDGKSCTHDDKCDGFACIGTTYECDDGLECTDNACDGDGGCIHRLLDDNCFIDGQCFVVGDRNPNNACEECRANTTWTVTTGDACDDGELCTTDDRCDAGSCVGGPLRSDLGFDWINELWGGNNASGFGRLFSSEKGIFFDSVDALHGGHGAAATNTHGTRSLWTAYPEVALIGLTTAGDAWLSARCSDVPKLGTATVALPTTPTERPFCVFKVAPDGSVSGAQRIALEPHIKLPNGDLYVASETDAYTTSGSISRVTASGEALWTVNHGGALVALAATGDDGLVAHLRADGGLSISAVGSSTTVSGPGINAIVRLRSDGSIAWTTPLYRSDDIDFRFMDRGMVIVHDSGELTFAGAAFLRQATFGTGANATSYDAKGFYSPEPPEAGAGGDGYIARLTADGQLRWVRFLTPLSIYGSAITSLSVDGEAVLFAGSYDRNAILSDGTDGPGAYLDDVLAADSQFDPPKGGVIGRFDADGTLAWWRGHYGMFTGIARSSHEPSIVAVLYVCEGTPGFPPVTTIARTTCRELLLSFNANLGFECSLEAQ